MTRPVKPAPHGQIYAGEAGQPLRARVQSRLAKQKGTTFLAAPP